MNVRMFFLYLVSLPALPFSWIRAAWYDRFTPAVVSGLVVSGVAHWQDWAWSGYNYWSSLVYVGGITALIVMMSDMKLLYLNELLEEQAAAAKKDRGRVRERELRAVKEKTQELDREKVRRKYRNALIKDGIVVSDFTLESYCRLLRQAQRDLKGLELQDISNVPACYLERGFRDTMEVKQEIDWLRRHVNYVDEMFDYVDGKQSKRPSVRQRTYNKRQADEKASLQFQTESTKTPKPLSDSSQIDTFTDFAP